MTQAAVRVDAGRLTGDLSALSAFGRTPSGGVSRTSYSAADGLARVWLAARCADAGFSVRVDGLGNVFARLTQPAQTGRCRRYGLDHTSTPCPMAGCWTAPWGWWARWSACAALKRNE